MIKTLILSSLLKFCFSGEVRSFSWFSKRYIITVLPMEDIGGVVLKDVSVHGKNPVLYHKILCKLL